MLSPKSLSLRFGPIMGSAMPSASGRSSHGVSLIRARRSKALFGISGSARVGGPHTVASLPLAYAYSEKSPWASLRAWKEISAENHDSDMGAC